MSSSTFPTIRLLKSRNHALQLQRFKISGNLFLVHFCIEEYQNYDLTFYVRLWDGKVKSVTIIFFKSMRRSFEVLRLLTTWFWISVMYCLFFLSLSGRQKHLRPCFFYRSLIDHGIPQRSYIFGSWKLPLTSTNVVRNVINHTKIFSGYISEATTEKAQVSCDFVVFCQKAIVRHCMLLSNTMISSRVP